MTPTVAENGFTARIESDCKRLPYISHLPQPPQRFDDSLDLVGAFLVFAAEVVGEFRRGGGGGLGEEVADEGDLLGEPFRPIGRGIDDCWLLMGKRVFRCRGGVAGDAEDIAEFGEEHLVVRALGGTGVFPAGDECFDGIGHAGEDGDLLWGGEGKAWE